MGRGKGKGPVRIALAAICLCLAGCGEIAYKRGSGGDEFSVARRDCRQQSPDDAAYRDCLAKSGWSIADLDPSVKTGPSSLPVSAPVPGASPASSGTPPVTGAASPSPALPSSVPDDPNAIVSIGSWWKAGSGQAALQASVNDCVAVLGPSHQPDAAARKVTRALYLCLTDHGWHGLGHAG